jgi:hypothetical protein
VETGSKQLMQKLVEGIKQLHGLLNVEKDFKKPLDQLKTYDVAHHAGLSLSEEYELLELLHELQRQEYLKRHLAKVVPMMAEMDSLKAKIKLNGHFKNLNGFDI